MRLFVTYLTHLRVVSIILANHPNDQKNILKWGFWLCETCLTWHLLHPPAWIDRWCISRLRLFPPPRQSSAAGAFSVHRSEHRGVGSEGLAGNTFQTFCVVFVLPGHTFLYLCGKVNLSIVVWTAPLLTLPNRSSNCSSSWQKKRELTVENSLEKNNYY